MRLVIKNVDSVKTKNVCSSSKIEGRGVREVINCSGRHVQINNFRLLMII